MASANSKYYSGSGVLIVDTKKSALLLVNDYTKKYNCCGGCLKYDAHDRQYIEKTAKEELYEETRTLISCDVDRLMSCPFVDLEYKHSMFRCYILKIECPSDICQQFEKVNLDAMNLDMDICYRETNSLAFFPLDQFKRKSLFAVIDKDSIAKSSNGEKCPLDRRVISAIKVALQNKLF